MTDIPKRPGVLNSPDHKAIGGSRTQSTSSEEFYKFLGVARVIHVDTETMVCSIRLETGNGERHDVPIPAPAGGGPRSWAGLMLEQGSMVVIGWKKYDARNYVPFITQVITSGTIGAREYEPFSTVDPSDAIEALQLDPGLADDPHLRLTPIRLKARKAYSGDFLASSSSGSDFILDRDSFMTNRAGNEFRLRDSDQTSILQTVNEFVNNSAGYYRRGLIKRNAFNLLPDLFIQGQKDPALVDGKDLAEFLASKIITVTDSTSVDNPKATYDICVVDKVSGAFATSGNPNLTFTPAYKKLLEFGIIDSDGKPTFPNDPNDPLYPPVVTPDGQRISYVVHGEKDLSFAQTDLCYVEDRAEIRHTHDGIMAVTEEGDGVQIDQVPPILIEDVKGTVVGNDPYSQVGRSLYKQILTMRVFDSPEDGAPSPGPKFEPVDTSTSQIEADTKALCRLFKVQSPTNSNQYAFGITKEGRVFLHIPKTQTGTTQEKGKSLDANIMGLIKAIIGADENSRTSIDLRTAGGIKLDIGAFKNEDPNDPELTSIDLTLRGKIRVNYAGQQGREAIIQGSDFTSMTGSKLDVIGGNVVRNVGGNEAVEASSITHNVGFGGYKVKSAGDMNQTVLGKTTEMYAQMRMTTFALADTKTMIAGVDAQTVLVGSITRTVVAGAGIVDTVTTGNYINTVGVGNHTATVGTGNFAATVAAGNLALTASAGTTTLTGSISASLISAAMASVSAPIVKIGMTTLGCAVAGIPGAPAIMLDYVTGMPMRGIPTILLG